MCFVKLAFYNLQGFVNPRAIAVSTDGSTIYVSDASEETPEKIYIFTKSEQRSRRHAGISASERMKGQYSQTTSKYSGNRNYFNIASVLHGSSKGSAQQRLENNRVYQEVYRRLFSGPGTKGTS